MKKVFNASNWREALPQIVCEDFPEYSQLYNKAWELAHDHVREIEGMPQSPYMDEAFCDTQIWIWDSCFMAMFCKFAQEAFPGVETFKNFYDPLYNGVALPEILPGEKEPWWTGATPNEPFRIKVHIADNPPLFAWAEYENALFHGDKAYLKTLLYEKQSLQRHYAWLESLKEKTRIPGVHCGTHWIAEKDGYKWECGVSGMDNTPRGRAGAQAEKERPNNPDMLWLDAICQQALAAKKIAELFALLGDHQQEQVWRERYLQKRETVNALYWDEEDKFYYDIDANDNHFYKVPTIASYWALTSGIATKERALELLKKAQDPQFFGGNVPLVSLAKSDGDFVSTGKYWRGSLWLPTAYAALKGFAEYGFYQEAHTAAYRIVQHMLATYLQCEPHTIWECYSPTATTPGTKPNGVDLVRKDFCGWSALGPISILIEYVLGFHTVNAFEKVVEWAKPETFTGKIGVKNLHFGDVVTDVVAEGNRCFVTANKPYRLKINGREYVVCVGENTFEIEKDKGKN